MSKRKLHPEGSDPQPQIAAAGGASPAKAATVDALIPNETILSCLDKIEQGIWIIDPAGKYLYCNDGLLKLAKGTKANTIGHNVHAPAGQFDVLIADTVLKEKHAITSFQDVYRKDMPGGVYRQFITQTPVFDANGEVAYIIAITEKVADLNRRLEAAQKNRTSVYGSQEGPDIQIPRSNLIAASPQMQEIVKTIHRVANFDTAVMISGESGTGKEVLVHELYECSNRADKPFVDINCAAIPETLLESELFGYEKGSFTGADSRGKKGLIEQANGGFLFLDEINSMPLPLQGKLLRTIETKTIRKIGGTKNIPVDFRIVTATNADLEQMCKEGRFREDLYYRLNVVPINIPPLRERKEDIVPLIELFLGDLCERYGKTKTFSAEAQKQLTEYSWPGNIRELRNLIERTFVTSDDSVIEIQRISSSIFEGWPEESRDEAAQKVDESALHAEDVTKPISFANEDFSLKQYLNDCEKEVLRQTLAQSKSTYEAARKLGISQASVVRKRQEYGL